MADLSVTVEGLGERNFRWAYALLIEVAKLLWLRQPQSKQLSWDKLDAGNKIALLVQAREDAGISEEEWSKVEHSGVYVIADLFEGERLVSERECHEQLMISNLDYKKAYETITIEPGRIITVVMMVLDRYQTGQLIDSMYGQDPKLVAGCHVNGIHFCDLSKKHEELRRNVNNALLTDASAAET